MIDDFEPVMVPPPFELTEVLKLLARGRVATAMYQLCREVYSSPKAGATSEFLLGLALCNTRADIHRLVKMGATAPNIVEKFDPAVSPTNPLFADPQLLADGYRFLHRARQAGLEPDDWIESHAIQRQTAEILLDFIVNEQKDPHMAALKVSGTPLRVIQLGYLCLVQLAERFIPEEIPAARSYTLQLEWARDYSAADQ